MAPRQRTVIRGFAASVFIPPYCARHRLNVASVISRCRSTASCNEQPPSGHLFGVSDRQQFEALYAAHAGAVRAYAMRRGPVADADDVVAEVFLIAWRRLQDVPEDARGWLLAVARRVQSNARRGSSRRDALRTRLEHERPSTVGAAPLVDHRLREALLGLRESDREALLLIAWEGLTNPDAARVLGVSESTFRVRLHRAKRRLARALADAQEHVPDVNTRLEVP
jgi:RNA polymerase sigma-70 factor (ECF subfamily)